MARTQATLQYLKACRQAWNTCRAVEDQAEKDYQVAEKHARAIRNAVQQEARATCDTALDKAQEDYKAAKEQEAAEDVPQRR